MPHWPYSPAITEASLVHENPRVFVGAEIVITEKLDGGNTLLHEGQVYARSAAAPSADKWMAMVKKHHAWKVREPDALLYGENIYAVHSIEYGAVPEDETYYAFALRDGNNTFASFSDVERYAHERAIPVVPVLFRGRFDSVAQIREFVAAAHEQASALGGEREGMVLRIGAPFAAGDFRDSVCKSVRREHVRTSVNWRRNWRRCPTTAATHRQPFRKRTLGA